jgi:hypothetical protein
MGARPFPGDLPSSAQARPSLDPESERWREDRCPIAHLHPVGGPQQGPAGANVGPEATAVLDRQGTVAPADASYYFVSPFGRSAMDGCLLQVSERPIASNSLASLASRAALTSLTS